MPYNETLLIGIIMSKNIKSILTTAMLNAEGENETVTDESGEKITLPETNEAAAKRLLKKFGLITLGTVAAVTAIVYVAGKLGNDEEDDENTED